MTEPIFTLGQKVIVNTGGKNSVAIIDYPKINVHGYFWEAQNSYLCRFTDAPEKTLQGGAIPSNWDASMPTLCENSQYINAEFIKPF